MSANRIIASPLARHLAQQNQIDLAQIKGSGPNGRIIKRDVEAMRDGTVKPQAPRAASAAPIAPQAAPHAGIMPALPDARAYYQPDQYDELPLDMMRGAIATRLSQSMQQLPHFYLTRSLHIDALLDYRARINTALADQPDENGKPEKISLNDLIVRACALALMDVPEVNVSFAGDAILRHHHADIGVAVALPEGLITPIVTKCDDKSIRAISAEIKDLAARAAEKRLKPSEYEGGSFSVSNLGMFGIDQFTAVINPPQAAILAVGGPVKSLQLVGDAPVEITQMRVTLSCDHRAIDGAVGAQFLSVLADYIEKPLLLSL
jgi:pyruvate dehydrogenase E2 component (dihydrolipoamide acetyltransferase)